MAVANQCHIHYVEMRNGKCSLCDAFNPKPAPDRAEGLTFDEAATVAGILSPRDAPFDVAFSKGAQAAVAELERYAAYCFNNPLEKVDPITHMKEWIKK